MLYKDLAKARLYSLMVPKRFIYTRRRAATPPPGGHCLPRTNAVVNPRLPGRSPWWSCWFPCCLLLRHGCERGRNHHGCDRRSGLPWFRVRCEGGGFSLPCLLRSVLRRCSAGSRWRRSSVVGLERLNSTARTGGTNPPKP